MFYQYLLKTLNFSSYVTSIARSPGSLNAGLMHFGCPVSMGSIHFSEKIHAVQLLVIKLQG